RSCMETLAMYKASTFLRPAIVIPSALMAFAALPTYGAHAAGASSRTIGYVLTNKYWAVYETPGGRAECPNGFNDGPREQFAKLFPNDGKTRTLLQTQLAREADTWFPANQEPTTDQGPLPYYYAGGKTAV